MAHNRSYMKTKPVKKKRPAPAASVLAAEPDYRPINPRVSPRFGDIVTFNRLPHVAELKGAAVDVAILGVPFDGGTTYRPGARFAPRAVRTASVMNRNFHPSLGVHVYDALNVVDAGDVSVNPLNMKQTLRNIEKRVGAAHAAGARTICVGGDHSILLGELRAIRKAHGEFTLIHFDAHTDAYDQAWGEKYHHGTPIRRAIEEKLIRGPKIFQIGIRGPMTTADDDEYVRKQKINTLDIDGFHDPAKRRAFFELVRKTAGDKPCFLTFDVDGVDPAYAPGTGTPVVGGMTSYEALAAVRSLTGIKLVGADVVEISPPFDLADITSLLGAALVFEFLALMAKA
jgi:agmatinase